MRTLKTSHDRGILLKAEERTRIEVHEHPEGGTVFRKVYRTPTRLRWRTFLLPSRARREFQAMRVAFDAGLPCIEPISCRETRRLACVASSEVTSRYTPGISLKAVLAAGLSTRRRRRVCVQLGRLLRRFHESGVLWMSAMPRNIIIRECDLEPMIACDLPYGLSFRDSIVCRRRALVDLYSMGFSKSRTEDFSSSDQRAFLVAYCGGDRAWCRSLWNKLRSRTKRRQTVDTTILHGGAGILLPAIRQFVSLFTLRSGKVCSEPDCAAATR